MQAFLPFLPLAAFLLGLLTALGGFVAYFRSSVQKKYAAERDFQHLRRNQEQLMQMLVQVDDTLNELKTEVVRIEARLK